MSFSVQVRTRYLLAICFLLVPIAAFSGDAASDASAGGARPKLTNRFRFLTAEAVSHFRYVDAGDGKVTARDVFYKLSSRVQLNIKADGRTYIQARGESGQNFIASYDYTGIGMHDAHWSFNLKSLFIGQKIGKYLEAQAGGIEFDRGAGTEVTYADNDAWLEGYRLTYLGSSHKILPEKINLTIGYVGDFLQPNIFAGCHVWENRTMFNCLPRRSWGRPAISRWNSIPSKRSGSLGKDFTGRKCLRA
jgi:hypothetical protein